MSAVAPAYAPAGRSLMATSVAGPAAPPEPVVRAELARLYGRTVTDWTHLTTVSIPAALPAAPPPQGRLRLPVALGEMAAAIDRAALKESTRERTQETTA